MKRKLPKPNQKTLKQLKVKYEPIIREIVKRRDGYKCAVAGVNHKCWGVLVADHWKGRGHTNTFFDIRNLTCICRNANNLKRFDSFLANAVSKVVQNREGAGILEELNFLSRQPAMKLTEDALIVLVEKYNQTYTEEKNVSKKEE